MVNKLKVYLASGLALAVTVLIFSGSLQAQVNTQGNMQNDQDAKTVVDVVKEKDNTAKFADMLEKSGFATVLNQQTSQFTVLAPKNEAVENLDPQLKENPQQAVQGQLLKGEMSKDNIEEQLGVKVEETDDSAKNGTVYVVDDFADQSNQQQQQDQGQGY